MRIYLFLFVSLAFAGRMAADGLAEWEKVYSVLTNPRCVNCHTATNYPRRRALYCAEPATPRRAGVTIVASCFTNRSANTASPSGSVRAEWERSSLRVMRN
jgi:hypothetical protein